MAVAFLALAGAFDLVSGIFRGVIRHQTIPDSMRGRLAGSRCCRTHRPPRRSAAVVGGGGLTTVRTSIVSGGILCVAGVAVTAGVLRDFWRYDSRPDEHAVRQRDLRAAQDLR